MIIFYHVVDYILFFQVDPISNEEYKVVDGDDYFVVNLVSKSCNCRVWDLEEIPCAHACAVIHGLNLDIYAFVSDYYFSSTLLSTYKGSVYLLKIIMTGALLMLM